jgi:hypothetical protein
VRFSVEVLLGISLRLHVAVTFCNRHVRKRVCVFVFCSSESKSVVNDGKASTDVHSNCSLHIPEWFNFDLRDVAHTSACTNKRGEFRFIPAYLLHKCDQ